MVLQCCRSAGGVTVLLLCRWCYSAAALQVVLQCCCSAGGVRVEATQLCTGRGLMLLTINGSLLSTRLMLNTVPDHLTAPPGNRFSPALCYTC